MRINTLWAESPLELDEYVNVALMEIAEDGGRIVSVQFAVGGAAGDAASGFLSACIVYQEADDK